MATADRIREVGFGLAFAIENATTAMRGLGDELRRGEEAALRRLRTVREAATIADRAAWAADYQTWKRKARGDPTMPAHRTVTTEGADHAQ